MATKLGFSILLRLIHRESKTYALNLPQAVAPVACITPVADKLIVCRLLALKEQDISWRKNLSSYKSLFWIFDGLYAVARKLGFSPFSALTELLTSYGSASQLWLMAAGSRTLWQLSHGQPFTTTLRYHSGEICHPITDWFFHWPTVMNRMPCLHWRWDTIWPLFSVQKTAANFQVNFGDCQSWTETRMISESLTQRDLSLDSGLKGKQQKTNQVLSFNQWLTKDPKSIEVGDQVLLGGQQYWVNEVHNTSPQEDLKAAMKIVMSNTGKPPTKDWNQYEDYLQKVWNERYHISEQNKKLGAIFDVTRI